MENSFFNSIPKIQSGKIWKFLVFYILSQGIYYLYVLNRYYQYDSSKIMPNMSSTLQAVVFIMLLNTVKVPSYETPWDLCGCLLKGRTEEKLSRIRLFCLNVRLSDWSNKIWTWEKQWTMIYNKQFVYEIKI